MHVMSNSLDTACAALLYVMASVCLPGRWPYAVIRELQLRRLLDVNETAGASEIKAAYRKRALQLHPDVNQAPDATQRFAELSHAYGMMTPCTATYMLRAPLAF